MSKRVVGIDLGTSTSSIAAVDRGQARVLGYDDRTRIIPSVVGFNGGKIVVGWSANAQLETAPEFTYTGLKRLLGRRHDEPSVVEWAERVAYDVVPGPAGEAFVRGPDRAYSPVELVAHIFRDRKEAAEAILGEEVTRAVIGAPAHFDMVQREALRQAALQGGVQPVRLLSEPVAAAVAYGVDRAQNRTIAIYDFGGGTFDVTILKITGQRFRVLATAGDALLGGEDFDHRIVEWIVDRFKQKHDRDLRDDPVAWNRVRMLAKSAKEELSALHSWPIKARNIAEKNNRAMLLHLEDTLDREVLDELVADLVDRTKQPCREALKKAKLDVRDIDEVVLVGGMTRMPLVQEAVQAIFERAGSKRINPVDAVSLGCALQGAALAGEMKSMALSEVLPRSIGLEVGNGSLLPMLKANRAVPARETVRFGLAQQGADAAAIRVYQGDLKVASENRLISTLVLNDLAKHVAPKSPLIDVTLDLDDDGFLTVSAVDVNTKEKITHRVHAESGMSPEETERLRAIDAGMEETEEAA